METVKQGSNNEDGFGESRHLPEVVKFIACFRDRDERSAAPT
jgi:hypothetical protein